MDHRLVTDATPSMLLLEMAVRPSCMISEMIFTPYLQTGPVVEARENLYLERDSEHKSTPDQQDMFRINPNRYYYYMLLLSLLSPPRTGMFYPVFCLFFFPPVSAFTCDRIFVKILSGKYLLTRRWHLDFGSHSDLDPDMGIFEGIFTMVGQRKFSIFC